MTPVHEDREKLALWMMGHGYATGHGDTIDDLLSELEWQINEKIDRERKSERERCAMLHEIVNPASDDERLHHTPGAGAMGAVIEYRDLIRTSE